jgi:hypothetical protein
MRTILKSAIATTLGTGAANAMPGGTLIKTGVGALATRVALRSLPGAALVGGLMLARHFYKKRKAAPQSRIEGSTSDSLALPTGDTGPR